MEIGSIIRTFSSNEDMQYAVVTHKPVILYDIVRINVLFFGSIKDAKDCKFFDEGLAGVCNAKSIKDTGEFNDYWLLKGI